MERKIKVIKKGEAKRIDTEYDFRNKDGCKYTCINELIEFLNNSKQKGATHIEFSGSAEYENAHCIEEVNFNPIVIHLESDEDFEVRKQDEIDSEKYLTEQLELIELKRLKEKYEL